MRPHQFQGMAANLAVIFVMKVINQFTTFQYSIYNSNEYHEVNGTCQLKDPEDLAGAGESPVMQVMRVGYSLAVVGGLVASKWFQFYTILAIGGAVMTLAVCLMAESIWFGLVCSQGFFVFVWIFHPLYMGLVLPCLLYGFFQWASGPRSRMVMSVLYYYSAEATSWFNLIILPIIKDKVQQHSYGIAAAVGLGLSLLFIPLSATLTNHRRQPYERPTEKRLIRYFQILTIFILFAMQLNDGHVIEYQQEILLYSNSTNFTQPELDLLQVMAKVNVPKLINMAAILSTSIGLALAGFCMRIKFVPHEHRVQIGIAMATAVAVVCFCANLILSRLEATSPILTTAVFCTAAFWDGVAEILTMVAVYEFVDLIGPRGHKLLLYGIALSIWSLASVFRIGLRFLVLDVIMRAVSGSQVYYHTATHAMDFLLLVACLAYCRYASFPLAFTLMQEDQADEAEDENDEQRPLLAPTFDTT